ncbi:MAG: hypothetical protein K0S65_3470, partial [Labilithrix sp.]|nr:hypothetical protein [Labilithrix sp.]
MNMLKSRSVLAGVTLSFAAALVACSGDDGAAFSPPTRAENE